MELPSIAQPPPCDEGAGRHSAASFFHSPTPDEPVSRLSLRGAVAWITAAPPHRSSRERRGKSAENYDIRRQPRNTGNFERRIGDEEICCDRGVSWGVYDASLRCQLSLNWPLMKRKAKEALGGEDHQPPTWPQAS